MKRPAGVYGTLHPVTGSMWVFSCVCVCVCACVCVCVRACLHAVEVAILAVVTALS